MGVAVEYHQFQPGQKVRNQFGETRTILSQVGCQVFVVEECNGHYHPSKLFPVGELSAQEINAVPSRLMGK